MKRTKINAYIMALYIFQFGLIQPIASIVNSQTPIIAFTFLLFIIMVLNNKFKFKKYVLVTFVLLTMLFILDSFFHEVGIFVTLPIYIGFIAKGFSGIIFGSLNTDGEELYNAFIKVGVTNFLVISISPFLSFYDSMNYMRFGYAMIPSTLIFFYDGYFSQERRNFMKILAITSLFLVFIYGTRGAILVFVMFCMMILYFSKSISMMKKNVVGLFAAAGGYVLFYQGYFVKLIDYVYYDIGIQTYALAKFRTMVTNGLLDSSSGRDYIYEILLNSIRENIYFGSGIGKSRLLVGGTAHNIILQILLEAGIVGLIVWFIIWINCLGRYMILSKLKDDKLVAVSTIIISIAIGRLLVSSDMWLRAEYWFAISLLINLIPKINLNKVGESRLI